MAIEKSLIQHFENHRDEILARLRSLAARLHELREPRYHMDLVYSAALRRAFSLTRGFFDLVAAENYVSAAPLVRLQLDNAIRTVASIHVRDVSEFIGHVAKGKRIDQLRDREGNRLTDKHIVDHIVQHEDLPWVRRVYQEGSRFVHLSDVHLFGLADGEGQLFDREPMFSDLAFAALVENFVMATELFDVYVEYWLRHKASKGVGEIPPKQVPAKDDSLPERLKALLRDHGLITCSYSELVMVDGLLVPSIRASAYPSEDPESSSLQLDIEVVFEQNVMCESFVGMGASGFEAIGDALNNFETGVLPILRVALWGRKPDYRVDSERWTINGTDWKVTMGPDVIRAVAPVTVRIPDGINETIKAHIGANTLAGDIHWLRLFYCQMHQTTPVVELLLDNSVWPEAQDAVRNLSWPESLDYYSLRRFLILQRLAKTDGPTSSSQPEA